MVDGRVLLVPQDGGPVREIANLGPEFPASRRPVAIEGRTVAVAAVTPVGVDERIHFWDLDSGLERTLDAGNEEQIRILRFLDSRSLVTSGHGGVRLWNLQSGTDEQLVESFAAMAPSPDGRFLLYAEVRGMMPGGRACIYDLEQRQSRELRSHGDQVTLLAWHPSGEWLATGSIDGTVRVGPVNGEEPHRLYGHQASVWAVAFHPGGEWLASASEDRTVRLWPMPRGEPLHLLPRDDLVTRLHALTNYRISNDPESSSGYRLALAPFPGWKEVPSW